MSGTTVQNRSEFAGRYLSVTSFRRDGTPVATPVWFVPEDGRVLVETDAQSYKVKRIRHNPSVTVATCTASGRLRGAPSPATAELLAGTEVARVERLMARKYRVDLLFIKPLRLAQAALRRKRGRRTAVVLAITPLDPEE
jgi:PPOX class probable F420-dependent enzyme